MSWVSKAYKKSGIRDIYEKNKSAILNTAAMAAILGTGGAAGLVGTGGLITGGTALGLGAGGLLMGASRDKKRKAEESAAKQRAAEEAARRDAGKRVDDELGTIIGTPNSPATGTPANPPIAANPGIPSQNPTPEEIEGIIQNDPSAGVTGVDPAVKQELIDAVVGGTPVQGGAVDTGGQASKDQGQLIDEAELALRLQTEQAGKSKAERAAMLKEYADLVTAQQNRILDENNPALLEDLNRRGLLRSSELGNAMGRERAKAASVIQEQVGLQGLNDREAYLAAMEGANTNYLSGRSGAIGRRFSLEDFARQAKVAKDTGIALQPIQTGTPSSKAGDAAMVGAGANVVTAMNGKGGKKA